MKLFLRIIFKIFLILTILIGCATTEEIKETDPDALFKQGTMHAEKGEYARSITYFNKTIEINSSKRRTLFLGRTGKNREGPT